MLVTQQPVLRRFWYPVVPLDQIQAEPKRFQLLGEPLLLWIDWFFPFSDKLRINYPNRLVHIIVNTTTLINDQTSQILQRCLRNDTEAETIAAEAKAFDRADTLEDKAILETTVFDVPLELKWEQHMATDQPGILMRHPFSPLFKAHGETEATHKKAIDYQKTKMLV
jgi:hypothetical protein